MFTAAEAYMISMICGMSNPRLVLMAAVMTMGIFLALTLYACTTKTDFTIYGGALFSFCTILFICGIFLMFTDNKVMHTIYAVAGVLLFSFYILYDT